jgi:hypothetical protein
MSIRSKIGEEKRCFIQYSLIITQIPIPDSGNMSLIKSETWSPMKEEDHIHLCWREHVHLRTYDPAFWSDHQALSPESSQDKHRSKQINIHSPLKASASGLGALP